LEGFPTIWPVVAVRWQDDESAVDRKSLEFDRKSDPVLVGKCGADFGPAVRFLAVCFEFLNGEGVEVREITRRS
jgi:hypothetical protein